MPRRNMPEDPIDRDPTISLVLTTVPDAQTGEELVQRLVEERLIACGNLVPGLLSLYRWEGRIAREPEVLVLMKVDAMHVGRLFERVEQLHPYDVPELVEVPVGEVSGAYCRWVIESTKVGA
jgi:periplasmic divalent cation tolerance protein